MDGHKGKAHFVFVSCDHRQQLAMECTELLKSIVQFRLHKRQVLEEAAQPYQEEKGKLLAREAALNIKGNGRIALSCQAFPKLIDISGISEDTGCKVD